MFALLMMNMNRVTRFNKSWHRWLAVFLPGLTQRASSRSILAQWLASQPAQLRIVLTVDSVSGELLSLESVSPTQRPLALRLALANHQKAAWQARGPRQLHRVNFDPGLLLGQKQDVLVALDATVSARLAAQAELMQLDEQLQSELVNLGMADRG